MTAFRSWGAAHRELWKALWDRGRRIEVGMAEAKDLFLATLPIGSGILAYWFAARGRSSSGDNDK